MSNSFIDNFVKKPPVLFPLAALFHLAMLGFSIYSAAGEPLSSTIWLDVLWMGAYTISWLFICNLSRWAAFTYIGLTVIDLVVHFVVKNAMYESSLFLIDVLFSMIVLAYYKRFR